MCDTIKIRVNHWATGPESPKVIIAKVMQPQHQRPRQLQEPQLRVVAQIRALVVKAALVQTRRPSSLLMFLAAPALFVILLGAVQVAVRRGSGDGAVEIEIRRQYK